MYTIVKTKWKQTLNFLTLETIDAMVMYILLKVYEISCYHRLQQMINSPTHILPNLTYFFSSQPNLRNYMHHYFLGVIIK